MDQRCDRPVVLLQAFQLRFHGFGILKANCYKFPRLFFPCNSVEIPLRNLFSNMLFFFGVVAREIFANHLEFNWSWEVVFTWVADSFVYTVLSKETEKGTGFWPQSPLFL